LEFEGQFRLLTSILGDKPLAFYDRKTFLNCREILTRIPPNSTKKKELRDLNIEDLVLLGLPGLQTNQFDIVKPIAEKLLMLGGLSKEIKGNDFQILCEFLVKALFS
jgi:hypothetical protein